jgi:hypothetical protein
MGILVCFVGSVSCAQYASAQSFPVENFMNNGPRSNRVNLVYLSDGYTSSELSTFSVHARNMNAALFATSPFKEYRTFFNASLVHVPSVQSGVLHPKTAPDCPASMPVASPTTYFETTFDYGNIHRLVVPRRTDKINTVLAASVPDYDQAFVVANSTEYGGSGGTYPAATGGNSSAFEVMIHELGHSFAYLADEYWAGPQYAIEKPNMTANSNSTTNKWSYWLGRGNIGIFPYSGSNAWFRPTQGSQCKMEALGRPFCSVCAEAIVLKIHTLVDVIQAVSPTNFNALTAPASGTIVFTLTLLKPDPNTLTVRWLLNGTPWGSANAESVTIPVQNLVVGVNSLTAEVVDATAMVRPANQPKRTLTWTINRTAPTSVVADVSAGGLSIFPNPAETNFALQYEASCASVNGVVEIVDMSGKQLFTKIFGAQRVGQNLVALDVAEAHLPEGTYLVSITTDCARHTGKMIVRQKR